MSKATRRLGRGLDSLVSHLRSPTVGTLGTNATETGGNNTKPSSGHPDHREHGHSSSSVALIDIRSIIPNPYQPRKTFSSESITELAASLKSTGVLQPILVRAKYGKHELIAGERRWRAARQAGLTEIPAMIRDATDEQMLQFSIIENLQREDLNAIDRAQAYRQFCDRFHLKPDVVATRLGEDRTTVVNYLRLLELSESIQELVSSGRLSMGHARCLLSLGDEDQRLRYAEAVKSDGLSVRALEEIVRREKTRSLSDESAARGSVNTMALHVRELQQKFEDVLKVKVSIIEAKRKGSGRVVLHYHSLDDFDRIATALGVSSD